MAIINGTDLGETLLGTDDADTINAKGGDDLVIGKKGDDIAFLGTGNDLFGWVPGDGSDTIDGEAGTDTLDFVGANVDENIQIFANAGKATFFRDIAAVTMTLDNVETHRVRGARRVGPDHHQQPGRHRRSSMWRSTWPPC